MATSINPDRPRQAASGPGAGWGSVAALLRRPHRGWRHIERAPASSIGLLVGLGVPLAAIGPAAQLVHDLVYGRSSVGIIQYRPTAGGAIVTALIGWAASLAALALLALAVGALGRRFGGDGERRAAVKVAVFGASAFFLSAAFAILPAIAFLQLLGLYSLFVLAIGAPRLMKVPVERAPSFGAAVAAVALVLAVALLLGQAWVAGRSLEPTVKSAGKRVVITGAPAIAGARLTALPNRKKDAAAPGAAVAAAGVVPASTLQMLLPTGVGGFSRTSVQSQSTIAGGVASAQADGTYVADTNSFTLTITDAGQSSALATTNSVIAGETERRNDAGYERSRIENGIRITEKWSNADHGGSYSRTVAGRFTVEARGTAPGIETLRQAVASVDARRLAALDR